MDSIQKFLRKASPHLREKIIAVMNRIAAGDLSHLDVQPYHGKTHCYRCRVGQVRILFVQTESKTNIVFDIDFRGNIYKRNR